jgi:hypothetical protein
VVLCAVLHSGAVVVDCGSAVDMGPAQRNGPIDRSAVVAFDPMWWWPLLVYQVVNLLVGHFLMPDVCERAATAGDAAGLSLAPSPSDPSVPVRSRDWLMRRSLRADVRAAAAVCGRAVAVCAVRSADSHSRVLH